MATVEDVAGLVIEVKGNVLSVTEAMADPESVILRGVGTLVLIVNAPVL